MADEMQVDVPQVAGSKRKASDAPPGREPARRIRALEQDVVNKIAAGEIIVAPVNALKELIENAVDAGSTELHITVKEGGLKLLQITDNGHGINKDDLPILCERFTTSKLKEFEDLMALGTYGFRGEALASISHIAHLTVTTKTQETSAAWVAYYMDGKLAPAKPGQSADPKPKAGKQGTTITVEDLFYNVPTRRRAFRSAADEYTKILDLVGRYAVHCEGVSFSCKKHGDASFGISVQTQANLIDRIRTIHGSAVANELIKIEFGNETLGFKCVCHVSNANYHVKRTTLLLFINHRAVDSSVIKKAIENTYSFFLPKGGHPFAYLSLEIDPQRIDVNIHPTKREVSFLNEDEIVEQLCEEIRTALGKVDTSRTFMTQTLLTGMGAPMPMTPVNIPSVGIETQRKPSDRKTKRPYENNLVRTDARSQKITSLLRPGLSTEGSTGEDEVIYQESGREPIQVRLSSVKELRAAVREEMHEELTDVFSTHTYVGLVDEQRRIVAMQGGVKLYLVDYGMICNRYFFQMGLTDFGNFGVIRFNPPLILKDILEIAAEYEKKNVSSEVDVDWAKAVEKVEAKLVSMREMLSEYFSMSISEDGELLTLPLLVKDYLPSMAKLPNFLLRLGPHVDWEDEKQCFFTFLQELAAFYVPEALPTPKALDAGTIVDEDEEITRRRKHVAYALEHVLFPAFKGRLIATHSMLKGVVEVANLRGLYKVFERC